MNEMKFFFKLIIIKKLIEFNFLTCKRFAETRNCFKIGFWCYVVGGYNSIIIKATRNSVMNMETF